MTGQHDDAKSALLLGSSKKSALLLGSSKKFLHPWYALTDDPQHFLVANATVSARDAAYHRKRMARAAEAAKKKEEPLCKEIPGFPRPIPRHERTAFSWSCGSRELDIMTDITAAGRRSLHAGQPFLMEQSAYQQAVNEWFEQQKAAGLRDIMFLWSTLSDELRFRLFTPRCTEGIVCWYHSGQVLRFNITSLQPLTISTPFSPLSSFTIPTIPDPREGFLNALYDIASYALQNIPYDFWARYFLSAARLLEQKPPQYLSAVSASQTGGGMGSWQDTLGVGTPQYKSVTLELGWQQTAAKLYAANHSEEMKNPFK